MRYLLVLLLICVLVSTAAAFDPDRGNQTVKTRDHVLQNVAFDRNGGNTIAEAVVIDELPFYDTGATCDNTHDYDEACPYTESLSPDVVYSYAPEVGLLLAVYLCESFYDTKTYVYDSDMNLIACNDDADCGYSGYQSALYAVPLIGGMTYYIIVDGYGGDCGPYTLEVYEFVDGPPCNVYCEGEEEGEPPLTPDYVDEYNGGCTSPNGDAWQILTADEYGDLYFCGLTGWYDCYDDACPDTDCLIATIGESGTVEIVMSAETDFRFTIVDGPDCASMQTLYEDDLWACELGTTIVEGDPGDLLYMIVRPTILDVFSGPVYLLGFTGLEVGPVAVEGVSFGSVKALYR